MNMHGIVKISDLYARFEADDCRSRASTKAMRKIAFETCLAAVGDRDLERFGAEEARALQRALRATFKAVTTNSYLRMVSPVFSFAAELGLIEENPIARLKPLRESRKRIEVYSQEEIESLLSACDRLQGLWARRIWQTRILLAVGAGLRRGEVLNLTVRDIDFESGCIWVSAKRDTAETWSWDLKGYADRKTPLPKALAERLTAIIAELPPRQPYVAISPKRYQGCLALRAVGKWTDALSNLPDGNFRQP